MHPVLFKVGGITVYSYGVFNILSFVAAGLLLLWAAKKLKVEAGRAILIGLGLAVGSFVGGRVGFVLLNLSEYRLRELLSMVAGQSIAATALLGALVGTIVVGLLTRTSLPTAFDLVTPAVVGGWALGNVGCFLAGCCWGSVTKMPWGVAFSSDLTPMELKGVPVHPVQLYALVVECALVAAWFLRPLPASGVLFLRAAAALLLMKVVFAMAGLATSGVAATYAFAALFVITTIVLVIRWKTAAAVLPLPFGRGSG